MPMLIVYTQIYIIKHGLLSIIDFKGMGIPYTLGSSDSSMLFYDIVATSSVSYTHLTLPTILRV